MAYTRFNVARSGDDGFGRSASDDDVSYAQLWVAFQPSAHAVDVALLVISPSHELGRELEAALSPSCAVTAVRPGAGLLRALRQARPHVVVVDRIDERPEAAQLEIALVKEQYPCARVIALSGNSSDADASTIEQGLFCYVAAPGDDELVRLIHAAARAAETERNGHT